MQGWVMLHRCLLDKPIWKNSTPEQCKILITLLQIVNHAPSEWEWQGQKFTCKEGQCITSIDQLVAKCGKGISKQNVRGAIARFEKLGFLTNESTKTGRLITIVNWSLYQSESKTQHSNQQRGNKEVTKSQQRGNKEVTPNNKDKNNNNVNNDNNVNKKKEPKIDLYEGMPDNLIEALEGYADMRKLNNKKTTEYAKKLYIKRLKEGSTINGVIDIPTAIKMVENATVGCWSSIFPLKENKQKKPADFLDFLEEE